MLEVDRRDQERLDRLLKAAKLPLNKMLRHFETHRISGLSPALIELLATGEFIDRSENILIFGNPGTGKTHLSIGLAREWCMHGRRILFVSASQLIQDLRSAQSRNQLHQFIKRLDRVECLLIDDISYIPLQREDTDCLFQLISERYERRSTLITSNLAFSGWGKIFKDEMTTAAVIDRLVHHCEILQLNAPSYRAEAAAQKRMVEKEKMPKTEKSKPPKSPCKQGEKNVKI